MIYLDNAASTQPRFFSSDYIYNWANPNSNHAFGLQAKQDLDNARDRIKTALGLKSGKVIFCRCATEAVEWLINKLKEKSFYWGTGCSPYEHDSCCNKVKDYPLNLFINCIEDYMDGNEVWLYLHQFCSHLTGQIFDIESIGKQVQSTGAFFGTDITAGLGKYPLPDNLEDFCDALWFSGRKVRCETMGALWLSDRLFDYMGGSQDSRNEYNLLHGSPNVGGAIALSWAVEYAVKFVEIEQYHYSRLVYYMSTKLLEDNILHHIYGVENELKAYAINALYLPGFNSDSLVQFLSSRDIYVSPCYSACSEDANYRTALALGMTKEEASQTVRISFSEDTCEQDIDALVDAIVEFKNLFV